MKYRIKLGRTAVQESSFEVEARSLEQAKNLAHRMAEKRNITWREVDTTEPMTLEAEQADG